MTSPSKVRGDTAEREVAAVLHDLLGVPARRELGAGRQDDQGDISGLKDTCIQVTAMRDLAEAVHAKLPALERQMVNRRSTFGALFCRRYGGKFIVVMTPAMFAALWREATTPTQLTLDDARPPRPVETVRGF